MLFLIGFDVSEDGRENRLCYQFFLYLCLIVQTFELKCLFEVIK